MCFLCTEGRKGGACKKDGVVYKIKCKLCKGGGVMSDYWGETAHTAYERGREHLGGLRSRQEGNSLWKHSVIHHKGRLREEDLEMGG